MRFFFISDNTDTATGLRLAGIDGVVVFDEDSAIDAFDALKHSSEIGIVLITPKVYSFCSDYILDFKNNNEFPLILEIPNRKGSPAHLFDDLIRELTGINI